ncbi:MAG: ROK family protein [Clostridia bacterium]|nr:ROK family protein [Clostridia bacterium]
MKNAFFCVDIGGTKTAYALYDEEGHELVYRRFPTEPEKGAEDLVARVYASASEFLPAYRVRIGSLATPGPLSMRDGVILRAVTMGWENVPIVRLFSERFGMPFVLLNDCDAGALGVSNLPQFSAYRSLCYMSLSTGIGGGIVINGDVYTGRGNAADFGHMPVPGEGLLCGCGHKDCLELYASGSGIEKRYQTATGKALSCAEIASLAQEKDPIATKLFEEASAHLAFAMDTLFAVLHPEMIALGGSVCRCGDLLLGKIGTQHPIGFAPDDGKQVLLGAFANAKKHAEKIYE